VLTLLKSLLEKGDNDAVLALVSKLLSSHNRQLKEALLKQRQSVKNEGVSSDQLVLLFKQLEAVVEQSDNSADQKLKDAS